MVIEGENSDRVITLEESCRAYIDGRKVTTWPAELWLLDDAEQSAAAARWLARVIQDVTAVRRMALDYHISLDEAALKYRRLIEGETYGNHDS